MAGSGAETVEVAETTCRESGGDRMEITHRRHRYHGDAAMQMFGGLGTWSLWRFMMRSDLHWFLWWVASCTGGREGEREREVSGASLANLDHDANKS